MANIIKERIDEKIGSIKDEKDSIIVFKGIPLSYSPEKVDSLSFEKIVENKMGYFMSIYGHRKYLSYEEFLLIADFAVSQYKTIYVINNNIYMNQYPINDYFSKETRDGLLKHFSESDEDDDDDAFLGDIGEFVSLFQGFREYNGYLLGSYCELLVLDSEKIVNINLFDNQNVAIAVSQDETEYDCNIVDENDYIDFVKKIFAQQDRVCVKINSYTGDMNRLKDHISMLAYYWQDSVDIYYVQLKSGRVEYRSNEEYVAILKKYWGYDKFRNLSVYDMDELENGEKKVLSISQEEIISTIVDEVEKCRDQKNYRDVFVTAPTGAGKSVMFQIPAMYLAEKYGLLTIVISPLIGLMNDQVKNLEVKEYKHAQTINSDISPIIKNEIIEKVSSGEIDILYISPETLLGRSDVEQLIGNRTIGMIVIDEAHIVTTWGKQFRPDYWYLGDHIKKLKKKQKEREGGHSFLVATFTATAIYRGVEDMYSETLNSLHMLDPITYLGYVKREDIEIRIEGSKKKKDERKEYELDKFSELELIVQRAIVTNKKTLIYFPTVALINRFHDYLFARKMISHIAVYHGELKKEQKIASYNEFYNKEKLIMLATKAFGMGIDINDIELIVHFAPTGNVCDYVQEIGRAARREDLDGEAYYQYDKRDFKHINRLHGLSTIQNYQLIKVMEKIVELYENSLAEGKRNDLTRRRNSMLLDAENFSYIFTSPLGDDESNSINRVKTALLLIQKDFEATTTYSPINVRPIPLFATGYFAIEPGVQKRILSKYPDSLIEIDSKKHVCQVMLDSIWKKNYKQYSFPKFKYLLYSTSDKEELDFKNIYPMKPALYVDITFESESNSIFRNIWDALKGIVYSNVRDGKFIGFDDIVDTLHKTCKINKYYAQNICEVVMAAMLAYQKNFSKSFTALYKENPLGSKRSFLFYEAVSAYFNWIEKGFEKIQKSTENNVLYLVANSEKEMKECSIQLGVLEAIGCLTFKMLGGANSQMYIYVNQVQTLKNIIRMPSKYKNRLLETVGERHIISVKMLTHLYEGGFTNEEMWNLIEDYFLGKIPEQVKRECLLEAPDMVFD